MAVYNLSITNFGHKSWSDRDRTRLMIAYKMGACLKTISRIVKRSVTATNKAISRFGYRSYFGTRRDMISNIVKAAPTYEQILAAIESYERIHLIDSAEETVKPARICKTSMPVPIMEKDPISRQGNKKTDLYVKFSTVLQECGKIGLPVERFYNVHWNIQGYDYLLNNRPIRATNLLVKANAIRREQGLPIYHVKGLTGE